MNLPDLSDASLPLNVIVFLAAAVVIGVLGTRLARIGDAVADRTGLGEALTGALFLGLVTALPGLAASITAAAGKAALASGNAVGGIALQTMFLAVADLAHRKANLEHAAASVPNMMQTGMLILLLTLVLLGLAGPETTIGHVHPVTPLVFLAAGAGFRLVRKSRDQPMWRPRETDATVRDIPEAAHLQKALPGLLVWFAGCAVGVLIAGVVVAHTVGNISDQTPLNATAAGAFLSGVATSLPELVTTVAAVRARALTPAVSDIVGGNFFDVLFVFAADAAFFGGSLYHAPGVGNREIFLTALAVLLNGILLTGLIFRQRRGPANIGFESLLILITCAAGFLTLAWM